MHRRPLLSAPNRPLEPLDKARVHRLEPLARPCALLLVARLGRAEVKTTRRLPARHGVGPSKEKTKRARRLGPRASISQAVRARRNPSPRTRAVARLRDGVRSTRRRRAE